MNVMSDNSEAFVENKTEMLEDEEMPTFVSVSSSKDISLPYNEDENIQLMPIIDNTANPLLLATNLQTGDDYEAQSRSPPTTEEHEEEGNDNDENEDGSVYVLSSGDDADDPDPSSRSYDEDIDEEEDVDEEEDEDIDDMDEIDADEEEVAAAEDGQLLGDFSEEEIEREDVMSDDLALRPDKPMLLSNEKRSQSLQDLSEYGLPRQKSFITGGNKYIRVQSKVRRYIQDLKEKNRKRSAENRLRVLGEIEKSSHDDESREYCDKLVNRGRRSLKDYAEQALKDLEIAEESQEDDNMQTAQEEENLVTKRNNNSQTKRNSKTEKHPNCEFRTASEIYRERKINANGEVANDPLKNIKLPKGITVNYTLNGQTQEQNILDVRSIGYDEYMRGSSNTRTDKNSEQNLETNEKFTQYQPDIPKLQATDMHGEVETNANKVNDIQNIEETPMEVVEHKEVGDNLQKTENNEKINREALAEIAMIQTQLNQKTTQCKEIREAYQKTLSENFQLKQELEDLKKTLSKLSAKKPTPVLVAVAIQTDPLPPPVVPETKDNPATENALNPKLSASSIGSAFSNNEHWTESAGSLPTSNGSSRPLPNLTPLSNAEDSFIGVATTPPRTPRQPSHAFQTSSKIIRMLSSITQRKSKTDTAVNGEGEKLENIFRKSSVTSKGSDYDTPISNRASNKRKASEMPENANFLQPPKIAHTSSSGSQRSHRRGKSEFKYPGDYIKINSQAFTPQSCDPNRTSDNPEDSKREDYVGDDLDSGVKCFTYREDDNSLETSFLIQAEDEAKTEDGKDPERGSGVVRECGPYLLGNVEVRMTEFNGTINIWGKEVSQETTTTRDEPDEEPDIEEELNERGAFGCWHKTPNARNSHPGPMLCSTNKKPKIPPLRLSDSGYLKNYFSPSTSTLDNFKEHHTQKNLDNDGNCRSCDWHNSSRACNKCKQNCSATSADEERFTKNLSNIYCCCHLDHGNCDYTSCDRVTRHRHNNHYRHHHLDCDDLDNQNLQSTEKCSRLSNTKDNEQSKTEESFNRDNQSSRFTNNFEDDNVTCRHGVRKNNANEDDDDVLKRPCTSNTRVKDSCCRNEDCKSRRSPLNDHSTNPLLLHHSLEPSESRRRRTSGKRVRGILMDFLRGCGDCRITNGPENKVSPSIVPQNRVRSSTPPPILMSQTQQRRPSYGSTNKRCVHMECCTTCSRKIEMAAEIETQLEIFGAEMERLRSRSQAVLGMLNTLHSTDTN